MAALQNRGLSANLVGAFRHDLTASIVVFLVALPLCMGIAVASGVSPAAGLVTGIVGGIVVGLIGGSPMSVSGPAAGLSVLVFERLQNYEQAFGAERALALLGVTVVLAGLIQIIAGVARVGQWFRAVSPAVVHGMLAGIGVLIMASQIHVMVHDSPRANGLTNLLSIPEAIRKGILPFDWSVHHKAAYTGLLTIATILLWPVIGRGRLKVIPAALIAVLVGTLAADLLKLPIDRIAVPNTIRSAINIPAWEVITFGLTQRAVILGALAMAMIASAETLLCAVAVDKMHTGPRTKFDRELVAQGIGNMLCGILGGLPMTAVIVRSAANVNAGAKTRRSAILHGVWLLLAVSQLPWLLAHIPAAVLAAVLVYTGIKLVDIKGLRELWHVSRGEAAIYIATMVIIVSFDLLMGVMTGVVLALMKLLYTFSHLKVEVRVSPDTHRSDMILVGAATFVRLPKLAAAMEQIPADHELHVHIEGLTYVDHACLELFMTWEKQHEATGGLLAIDWENFAARFRAVAVLANIPAMDELGDGPKRERRESRGTPLGV